MAIGSRARTPSGCQVVAAAPPAVRCSDDDPVGTRSVSLRSVDADWGNKVGGAYSKSARASFMESLTNGALTAVQKAVLKSDHSFRKDVQGNSLDFWKIGNLFADLSTHSMWHQRDIGAMFARDDDSSVLFFDLRARGGRRPRHREGAEEEGEGVVNLEERRMK